MCADRLVADRAAGVVPNIVMVVNNYMQCNQYAVELDTDKIKKCDIRLQQL